MGDLYFYVAFLFLCDFITWRYKLTVKRLMPMY